MEISQFSCIPVQKDTELKVIVEAGCLCAGDVIDPWLRSFWGFLIVKTMLYLTSRTLLFFVALTKYY